MLFSIVTLSILKKYEQFWHMKKGLNKDGELWSVPPPFFLIVWTRIRAQNTDPQSCRIQIQFGSVSTTQVAHVQTIYKSITAYTVHIHIMFQICNRGNIFKKD